MEKSTNPSTKVWSSAPIVHQLKIELSQKAKTFLEQHQRKPKLVVLLIGNDPASMVYVKKKSETAQELGLDSETLYLEEKTSEALLKSIIDQLNSNPFVDGILIQRPLPQHLNADQVSSWVNPNKDVDALHPENIGLMVIGNSRFNSCTPQGVMELLKFYQYNLKGKNAVVIGRSLIVGRPVAQLLMHAGATVTLIHRQTKNPKEFTQKADLLVVAAGQPKMIDSSWIKEDAVVIDVGIHKTLIQGKSKLVGDVDFDSVINKVKALTPVPGGVGPMTIYMLMNNTLIAANSHVTKK